LFCDVLPESVFIARDEREIYAIPVSLKKQNLHKVIAQKLNLTIDPHIDEWEKFLKRIEESRSKKVKIAVVGKYIGLKDAYISIYEAIKHAGWSLGVYPDIIAVDSENIEDLAEELSKIDGIIVPGGFGERGIEGKIEAVRIARENNIPFLGLCLGMQIASIEFARNVCQLKKANSMEFDPKTPHPIITLMDEQKNIVEKGGSMRLGLYPCKLKKGTHARKLYQEALIYERHRHRYEFNTFYRSLLEEKGIVFAGLSPDERLVEIIEYPANDYFVAVQFHPEFLSNPLRPHPLFKGLLETVLKRKGS
jgi:CTP synthase